MDENSSFQFVLPIKNADLLNSSGDNYYVQQIYTINEIPEKLLECRQKVHQGDPFYIFEHFDTYFSVIEWRSNDASSIRNMMRSFDLLYLTVDKLGTQLTPLLGTTEPPSVTDRACYLNLTKMTLYLLINIVKRIDVAVQQINKEQQLNLQKKQRGKQAEGLEQYPDWDVKRGKFLVQLFNIMQCQLEKLWNPPVPEENFVNMICDICYRTLELTHIRVDNRHIIDTLFQIFGTAIKRYNHALTFPVRLLQVLRNSEHAGVSIASGILLLNDEYGITSIFSILIKDIVETLIGEANDTVVSRNFSNFLTEFAHIAPKLMIPHLSKICEELLDCESHMLRNAVLQIMGDAIVGELTSEDLSDEMKEARNEFLECLLEHINDVSAHVRSKVLHIWHSLKEENAVPLSFLLKVLREAVCRLEDKTATVRKCAVQLIKAFLESNPFSGKLTFEELVAKYNTEHETMEKLKDVLVEERKKIEDLESEWTDNIVPLLIPIIEANLKEFPQVECDKEEDYESLVNQITMCLVAKEYKEAMVLVRKADVATGNTDLNLLLKLEERCPYFLALFKTFVSISSGCRDSTEQMQKQIEVVQFLEDSIEFCKVITKAMIKIQEFLVSKTNSDVFEAVDLFTTGYMFGIKGTETGMQQMLYLVWSSDKEKRDAVSNAYRKVLFTTDQTGRAHAIKVVQNLSRFLTELEYGHYMAMESLMCEWVTTDDIDAMIVQVLFERFTLKLEGTTNSESRRALQLLIMASQAKYTIASANVAVIESIATSERAAYDPRLFVGCLQLLLNSIDANQNSKFYKRLTSETPFVQKVISMFLSFFFHPALPNFDSLATSTLEFFYKLCQAPDIIAQQLIFEINRRFNATWVKTVEFLESLVHKQQQQQQELTSPLLTQGQTQDIPYSQTLPLTQPLTQLTESSQPRIQVYLATRFIFCIGYMTLKEMIFLDIDVYNNMKYREELTQLEEKKNKNKKTAVPSALRRPTASLNVSAMEVRKRLSGNAAEPQQEPDEDLVGATAEDNIAEEINAICEDILLFENSSLLSKIYPLIINICKKPGEYRDQKLQQSASLTLARLMTVSSKFCETNMSFLMNILNLTKNIKIKCNSVVSLSDLTFRFPNVIEPWSGHFYLMLHEENRELRLTAVKMLSHLTLHEMIRVKGQIADLAMCIVDPDDEIKSITKEFFKEIANKSNILYNVLPDIISKLSDIELNLEEEKYHVIMRHIMGLIQKDRQVETLVEKLCMRFPVTREERQWRDIAYCLSLLTYNERAIKKLIDNVQHYKDKVQIDEVHQAFKLIISNTSKLAKPELKAVITELETRIKECLEVRDPNAPPRDNALNETNQNTGRLNATKVPASQRQRVRRGGRSNRTRAPSTESDSSDETPIQRQKKGSQRNVTTSEESTSEDERTVQRSRRGRRGK